MGNVTKLANKMERSGILGWAHSTRARAYNAANPYRREGRQATDEAHLREFTLRLMKSGCERPMFHSLDWTLYHFRQAEFIRPLVFGLRVRPIPPN